MKPSRFTALLALVGLGLTVGISTPALADEPRPATTTLKLEPTRLDPEGSKAGGTMYFPSAAKLTEQKPAIVKKEPKYRGTPKYTTVRLGNAGAGEFALAFDEVEGQEARVYVDVNGDGDLTNDGDGAWPDKRDIEGQAPQYAGTFKFNVGWKNADGAQTTGQYGLNFYRSPDRESVFYYRAGARTGEIELGGRKYEVMIWENDNDALYNKTYTGGEVTTKAVAMTLDGDQVDIRGTFPFGDTNYLATVTDDGAKLTMTPTARVVRLPRAGGGGGGAGSVKAMAMGGGGAGGGGASDGRPALLQPGTVAPDFSVIAWRPELPAGEEPPTIKLSDFKGKKVVVVDFWATWCGPCMRGLPHVNRVAEAVKGQDVVVLALNTWDDQAAYERFARGPKGKNMTLSLVRDPAGRQDNNKASIASRLYNVSGIPVTYVIDKEGKIAAAFSGYSEGDKSLEVALKSLGVKLD